MNQRLRPVLVFLLLAPSLFSQNFPDGRWNGKPWPKERLLEQVEAGNPDALAEWADCVDFVELGIPCDREKMFQYAAQAAEAGSVLGKLKLGRAYFRSLGTPCDQEKGLTLITEAAELGHPAAIHRLAVIKLSGPYRDHQEALRLLKTIENKSVQISDYSECLINLEGARGFIDLEDGYQALSRCFEKTGYIQAADKIYRSVTKSKSSAAPFFDEEIIGKAEARLREAIELNHEMSKYRIGYQSIRKGNPNEGVPLVLEAANDGNIGSIHSITHWCRNPQYNSQVKKYVAKGESISSLRGAAYLYRNNVSRDNALVASNYARYLAHQKREEKTKFSIDDESVEIYRRMIKNNRSDRRAYISLASYISQIDGKENENPEATEHSRNIYIYRTKADPMGSHWLSWNYILNPIQDRKDLIKGYAAVKYAIQRNKDDFLKEETKWVKRCEDRLSPEQLKEANLLIEDGFPHSEKYRKAAFEYLKEKGDIPKNRIFDDDLPKNRDNKQARAPATGAFTPLFALLAHSPLFAVDESSSSFHLLSKLAKGEDFEEQELPDLARVLLSSDAELMKQAAKISPEFSKLISETIIAQDDLVLDKTPLETRLLWHLYCDEEGNATSRPALATPSPSSVAHEGKLHTGDVFKSVYGVDLKGTYSRNHFVRLLSLWPKDKEIKVTVLRSKWNSKSLAYSGRREIEKKRTFSLRTDSN